MRLESGNSPDANLGGSVMKTLLAASAIAIVFGAALHASEESKT